MNVKTNLKIHNRFDVEVRDKYTGKLKQRAQGENIVLDKMYDRLCAGSSYFTNIHFGSGNTTPVATNTALNTHEGTKSATTVETVKAIPTTTWQRMITLEPEDAVGVNIRELGIAYGSTSSYLVTHALLEDSEGNSISILKTDTDVVYIYATVFITLENSNTDLVYVPINRGNDLIDYLTGGSFPYGSFGMNEILNSYQRLGSSPSVSWTADISNKKRKTDVVRFDKDTANGHVQAIDFSDVFQLKLPSTGIFAGQDYAGVSVGTGDGVEDEFELPSRNIKDGSLVVKIDGTTTTAFTSSKINLAADLATPPNMSSYGYSVSLSSDGSVLAVGTYNVSPYVKIYDWDAGWTERATPPNMPSYGWSVSLSSDGSILAVGIYSSSPYVKVYDYNGLIYKTRIKFTTAPASAEAITADYTVNGIHKTINYVVDMSYSIYFGEGV